MTLQPEERLLVLAAATRTFLEASDTGTSLLEAIAREVADVLGDACTVWMLAPGGRTVTPAAFATNDPATHDEDRAVLAGRPINLDDNAAASEVIERGEPVHHETFNPESLRPPAASDAYHAYAVRRGMCSIIRVPLRARGTMVGMLALTRFAKGGEDNGYGDDDLLLALALADHAALALLKARAREDADAARDELARTNAAHQLLFEANPVPMFVVDVDTLGVLAVNDAALALYGYTRAEFLALPIAELRPPEERAAIAARMDAARDKDLSLRIAHVKKGGARITVDTTSRPISFRGRAGRLVVVQDVTTQIKLEEQLRQSQKMEAIGVLAGGVAHDFNNLLSVIIGFASLALDTLPADAPQRADIDEIRGAGERAASLTRQLLAFSRKQVLQPRDVDVNGVIRQLMAMLRRLVPENIAVTFAPSPALGVVRVDPSQLEQVLLNLVVNAKDAITGSGRISISTTVADVDEQFSAAHLDVAPGKYAVIEVADDGSGMDKATQEQIFEPFFTTKPVGQGSGLGLSTVFGIVKQSGGTVWVYSEPGDGTTFKVFLPLAHAAEAERPATPSVAPGGSETVLLVEDEAQVRRLVEAVLTRAGYRVLLAADGTEALRVSRAHAGEIAVLVTDVVMPGLSGREVATQLGQERPTMRVVFMSGYTDDPVVQQRVAEEGAVFLQKPVLSATLLGAVRTALDRKRA